MTDNAASSPEEIAEFIVEFCRGSRITPAHGIAERKRELWRQMRKRWPDAPFVTVNRALSVAYEALITDANKHGVAIIDAFRRGP
jgi:hypothetical protein